MSNEDNYLTGQIGQPAHFNGDYLFKKTALPNSATIYSEEYTFNNTLGALKIRGYTDESLTVPNAKSLNIKLQYKDGPSWVDDMTLLSATDKAIAAGDWFEFIPVPSTVKRIFRLAVTSDFNASAVELNAAVEFIAH
jgi:uncharacterized membrane protein